MKNCKHCGGPFDPVASHQIYCSRSCTTKGWNIRWRQEHPYPREHHAWRDMRRRCNNPKHADYPHYGARGITVCERWNSFDNFIADMGPKPDGLSLERIDNNKGYGTDNCKWATKHEQASNRTITWTKQQDEVLRTGAARGDTFVKIAAALGKTDQSVSARARRLGIKSSYNRKITDRPAFSWPATEGSSFEHIHDIREEAAK